MRVHIESHVRDYRNHIDNLSGIFTQDFHEAVDVTLHTRFVLVECLAAECLIPKDDQCSPRRFNRKLTTKCYATFDALSSGEL
jgi:hypothetical protein